MIKMKIFYASKDAKRKYLYKEGQTVTIKPYLATQYKGDSWNIDLDDSGTNYIQGNVEETL